MTSRGAIILLICLILYSWITGSILSFWFTVLFFNSYSTPVSLESTQFFNKWWAHGFLLVCIIPGSIRLTFLSQPQLKPILLVSSIHTLEKESSGLVTKIYYTNTGHSSEKRESIGHLILILILVPDLPVSIRIQL